MSTDGDSGRPGVLPVIYVDADACPVKAEVLKVAERRDLKTVLVANSGLRPSRDPNVQIVTVGGGFDEADDWIAERITSRDICVTNDVPLASRCVEKGAVALSPGGRVFDETSTAMALAMRNLGQHVREAQQSQTYNPPFSARDRSTFLQSLERLVRQRMKF